MTDSNKKSPRSFQCREALWQKFEQMAQELECSVDYLINDAMKQYARQRGYVVAGSGQSLAPSPAVPMAGAAPPPPPPGSASPARAAPPPPPGVGPGALPAPLQRPGGRSTSPLPPARRPPPAGPGRSMPPPPPGRPPPAPGVPPPHTGAQHAAAQPGSGNRTLAIHYEGEVFPINKDRFIIGRGKQSSDLTIKDPNVSRQHAMIEFLNGQFYIVDMGSTNGVEFNGQRVQRKAIGEGDVFRVCDHELLFSFHA
jgi:hypothetical protein